MSKTVAFFDFDGTITTRDSYKEFLLFCFGKKKFIKEMLSSIVYLIAFVFKIIDNQCLKKHITRRFFAGMPTKQFDKTAKAFAQKRLEKIVRPKALKRLKWHKKQGHRVIVVSASFEKYLRFWCKKHKAELIGTRLEEKNDILTGEFCGANCYGPEKPRRINAYCQIKNEYIFAYGDSKGDNEMLAMANKAFRAQKIFA